MLFIGQKLCVRPLVQFGRFCVCACVIACVHVEDRGQPLLCSSEVIYLYFCCCCCFEDVSRWPITPRVVIGLQAPGSLPVPISLVLGLSLHITLMGFRDLTQVFMITRQAFYWPSHLPSPQSKGCAVVVVLCVCVVCDAFLKLVLFCFLPLLLIYIYSSNAATMVVLFYFVISLMFNHHQIPGFLILITSQNVALAVHVASSPAGMHVICFKVWLP